jgi:hypothetical protein
MAIMRMVVAKSNFSTDNPECLIGEENFFLTRGYHTKVMTTVMRQITRER